MNGRAIGLMVALGVLVVGWAVVALWPDGGEVTVEVKQRAPRSERYPSAQVIFGIDPALELTEVLVERLDEATEIHSGMVITQSAGPGPIWRLVPADDRDASDEVRIITFGRRGGIGMQVDLATTGLDPGVRYKVTVKGKDGRSGSAEFVAEPNPRANNS